MLSSTSSVAGALYIRYLRAVYLVDQKEKVRQFLSGYRSAEYAFDASVGLTVCFIVVLAIKKTRDEFDDRSMKSMFSVSSDH